MTIPEIRARLHELADLHGIPKLHVLADATKRRPPVRKAPAKRRSLTPALEMLIRAFASAHPTAGYPDIADHFGVNQGRVSEALAGKRE